MQLRHSREGPAIARARPLVGGLALAASLATGCTAGATTPARSADSVAPPAAARPTSNPVVLRRVGLSMSLPPGWDGRISAGTEAGALPAVLHAASFRLRPGDGDDLGGAASRRMRPGDIQIVLYEFPPEQVGRGGFRRRRTLPIAIRAADVLPALRAIPRDHAIARARFSFRGRPFSLFVEFGRRPPSPSAIRTANRVLASLEIRARPELAPAVWRALRRRPLALAAISAGTRCPRSRASDVVPAVASPLGRGPAYASVGSPGGVAPLRDDLVRAGWYLHKVLWAVSKRYGGPVLIRGRRLDTRGPLRFGTGKSSELRVPSLDRGVRRWRYAPSYAALRGPGCYAFRVDGTSFRSVIVFEAR